MQEYNIPSSVSYLQVKHQKVFDEVRASSPFFSGSKFYNNSLLSFYNVLDKILSQLGPSSVIGTLQPSAELTKAK